MVTRYMLGQSNRKALWISPGTHDLIKLYAKEKGLTIVEATFILLRKAILQEEGLDEVLVSKEGTTGINSTK